MKVFSDGRDISTISEMLCLCNVLLELSKINSGTNVRLSIWLQYHQSLWQINWTNQSDLSCTFRSVSGNQWFYAQRERGREVREGESLSPGPASDPLWGTVPLIYQTLQWPSWGRFKCLLKINQQHSKSSHWSPWWIILQWILLKFYHD